MSQDDVLLVLAELEDGIFEALKPPHNVLWHEQLLDTIPGGVDLSLVWPKFAIALLNDPEHGVLRFVQGEPFEQQKQAIEMVVDFYEAWVASGTKPATAAAARAAYAAVDAAAAAAEAAAAADAAAAEAAAGHVPGYVARVAAVARAAAAAVDAAAAAAAEAAAHVAGYAVYADRVVADAATAAAAADTAYAARLWQAQTLLTLLANAPRGEEQ